MRRFLSLLLFLPLVWAQTAAPDKAGKQEPSEDQQLSNALSEAGSSPIEFIRTLERHLAKFPNSPRKAELERALAKAAIENKDDKRIIQYGERVLPLLWSQQVGDLVWPIDAEDYGEENYGEEDYEDEAAE